MSKSQTELRRYFSVDAVPGFHGRAAGTPSHFVPELLGLRGVGILIVVIGHMLQRVDRFVPGALRTASQQEFFLIFATPFTGCCLLFCLSGYALVLSSMRSGAQKRRPDLLSYLRRRIVRLFVPYAAVLIGTFLFLDLTGYQPSGTYQYFTAPESVVVSLFASLMFVHEFLFGTFPRLFPPGWFLETMVQFYVIGPLILRLYLRIPAGKVRIVYGLWILVAFVLATMLCRNYGPREIQYSILAFLPFFWTGIIVADARLIGEDYPIRRVLRDRSYIGWLSLAAFVVLGSSFGIEILRLVAQIMCLTLMLGASFIAKTSFQSAMVGRWLTRVGVASYAIFLVHLQILQVAIPVIVSCFQVTQIWLAVIICGVLGIPLVMSAAAVFYWLVERPFVVAAERLLLMKSSGSGMMAK